MDFEKFQGLRKYVGLDARASELLLRLSPLVARKFPAIIDDFYEAISQDPGAHQAIRGGEAQVQRLKQSLGAWLQSLLSGVYDEAYVERHARIGRVHVEINLPQELMFSAMNRIRVGLVGALNDAELCEDKVETQVALHQILDVELGLMLDTYRMESDRRIRMGLDEATAQTELLQNYESLSFKLRESERRTREIVDGVPAFVTVLDEQGQIAFWNRQLEQVTGFVAEEMLGREAGSLLETTGTVRLPLKGGGHRLARWQQTKVQREDGLEVTYALGVDITDEAEMQRRATRAERLAAVGTLAAGLAHEVRNPLNSASLQLQTLRRRLKKGVGMDGVSPIVDRVEDEIRRLDGLVGDFLAFARPGAFQLGEANLNELVSTVADMVRPELLVNDISLSLDLSPTVGNLSMDAGQITQVTHNLVRNAAQALGRGGKVTIRTLPANSQAQVTLEVEDTGPGFSAQAPIFDAFYTTKSTGTGLGLAIVHRIIQEHGGSIAADSAPGRTVFRIRLPQPASNLAN